VVAEASTVSFDRAVAEIAARFVNQAPDHVDREIERALGRVCLLLDTDLATVLLWNDPAKRSLVVSHEWSRDTMGTPHFRGTVLSESHPWLSDRLRTAETLRIDEPGDFPAEAERERATCKQIGLQSIIWVPFKAQQELEGYVAVNTVRRTRRWSDEVVDRLRLIGQVFANAIEAKRSKIAIETARDTIRLLKDQLETENRALREEARQRFGHSDIIGKSHALVKVLHEAKQVAPTDTTVLLLGETGTGKSLIARMIHGHGRRANKPFLTVDCPTLSPSLIESELFGHEKGAFTGAIDRRLGRFEVADGGTVFLDEIGDFSLGLQAKLLRVLQSGQFERLGSSAVRKVDVHVIAATNRDLDQMVTEGRFRSDLFYRLGVFPIHMPPLRDRREDIPMLAWFFVERLRARLGKTIESIPDEVMRCLKAHPWPGNIRELKNTIQRANVQREHIIRVLEECDWRVRGASGAAERLGLHRSTLQSRMRKLGIERPPVSRISSPRGLASPE
jgi:transcriptional regulator with GAF, ATPase, and Fis domain